MGKLRNGKAGGESGIFPEMVKATCCEEEFVNKLLDLVNDVWFVRGAVPPVLGAIPSCAYTQERRPLQL